jgi:hypothetical protein
MGIPSFSSAEKPSLSEVSSGSTNLEVNQAAKQVSEDLKPQANADQGKGKGDTIQLSKEEADKLYEENMEEEYAKREGGA